MSMGAANDPPVVYLTEPPNDWVSKKGFAEELVITEGVLDGWMQRFWTKGHEYAVIGRTTFIHRKRANEWIGKQAARQSARRPDIPPLQCPTRRSSEICERE